MNLIGTSLKLTKKQRKILVIFLTIGLVLGFILSKKIDDPTLIESITNISSSLENNHINFILLHILVLAILIASSLMVIGIFLFPLYFLFELTCISYSIFTFISIFHLSGLIYGILYNIFIKLLYLILLYIIFKNILMIIKSLRQNGEDPNILKKHYQKVILSILFIFIYDLFLYLLGSTILLKLSFIIT